MVLRVLMRALIVVAALSQLAGAKAEYPERPIHLVVGFAAGGGADFLARVFAQALTLELGQSVVVENRAGANGSIAADVVAHAEPDGYTLAWITNSHTITPALSELSYDPVNGFEPIMQVATAPDVLLASLDLPVDNLKDLIAYAKENPGKLNYGSSGTGTPNFLEMELLKKLAGMEIVNVSYGGGGPTITALLSGEVQIAFASPSNAVEQVEAGKLKALAVTSIERSELLPDVPTIAEAAGLTGFDGGLWYGVLAPAGTPQDVVARLHAALSKVKSDPTVQDSMRKQGFVGVETSPQEFKDTIVANIAEWTGLVKELGTQEQ